MWRLPASKADPLSLKRIQVVWKIDRTISKLPKMRHWYGFDVRRGTWRRLVDVSTVAWSQTGAAGQRWPKQASSAVIQGLLHPTTGEIRLRFTNLNQSVSLDRLTLDVDVGR